jgi:uroporphyrinogen-III synthase
MSPDPLVLLTRPEGENEQLAERLAAIGIRSRSLPCVRTVALADRSTLRAALRALGSTDVLVVTSRAGAYAIGDAFGEGSCRASVAAVGEATAEACRAAGLEVTFVPAVATGVALAEELPLPRGAVVLARSDRAASAPADILRGRGATVREVIAYRTESVDPGAIPAADAVVFASPSAVDGFSASGIRPAVVVAIGPTTAARVRSQLGIDPLICGPHDASIAALVGSVLGGPHATAAR